MGSNFFVGILVVGVVLISGCVEEGTETTTTTLKPETRPDYCELDSDCGWVGCCSYGYTCMRKDALSCPDDIICLAYSEPKPVNPCVCVDNKCSVQPTQGIIISTDKAEYWQGETVKVTISNVDEPLYVSYKSSTGFFSYQLKENVWSRLEKQCEMNCIMVCENDTLKQSPCIQVVPPLYHYYEYTGPWVIQWDQRECVYETRLCGSENYSRGSLKQASAGRYRVEFCYFNREDVDLSKPPGSAMPDEKKCTGREFTIKEREVFDCETHEDCGYMECPMSKNIPVPACMNGTCQCVCGAWLETGLPCL